jgi:ParB/RepB/Spo0J family partition protein
LPSIADIQAKKAAQAAAKAGGKAPEKDAEPQPTAQVGASVETRHPTPAARSPQRPAHPAVAPVAARPDPGAIAEARTQAKLAELSPNPLNPRTGIDPKSPKMLELRRSLKEQGQLHPVPVVTVEHFRRVFNDSPYVDKVAVSGFVIIGGGRRFVAATAEGLLTLKINVMHGDRAPQTPADWMALTLSENVHQDTLSVMQTARGVAELRRFSSGRSVAQTMSKSPGWVTQYLQLNDLSSEVQAVLESAPFSLRQARRVYDMGSPAAQLREAQAIQARLLKTEATQEPPGLELATEPEPDRTEDPEPGPVIKRTGRPAFTPAQKLGSRLEKVDRDTVLDALVLRFPSVDRIALGALLLDPPSAEDKTAKHGDGV